MLSSNNQSEMLKKQAQKNQRFTLKKLSVGVASVLIGLTFMGVSSASADTNTPNSTTNQPVVVNTNTANQSNANQSVNEKQNVAATDTNTTNASANQSQPNATVAPATENDNTQSATENKNVSVYYITVTRHDVTRGGNVQTLNRSTGHYSYWTPETVTLYSTGNGQTYQAYKKPIPGYKLLNPEVLDQYFNFNDSGSAVLKEGVVPEKVVTTEYGTTIGYINITLNYAVLSPIQVEYVDTDNGHVLASMKMPSYYMTTESFQHQNGDVTMPDASKYEGAAFDIPGYKLVSAPVLEGQIDGQTENSYNDENPIRLVFQYKKVMDNADSVTTTTGKGSTGAVIVNSWENLPGMFRISGVQGQKNDGDNNGDVEKRSQALIDHYRKQGFSYIGTTNKLYNDDYYNNYADGTYIYLVPNKPVLVNYVDEDGNKLADSDLIAHNYANPDQTANGINASSYWYSAGQWTAKLKDIKGYHLVKTEGATSGNFTPYQYVTTFVYAKNSEIIDPNDPTPDHPTDPTKPTDPTNPTNPTVPTTPTTPENRTNPTTPVDPTTPANPGMPGVIVDNDQPGQPASPVAPVATSQQVTPAKANNNAHQLPQTGNDNQAAVLGLGMGAVASLLGLLGLNKKREN